MPTVSCPSCGNTDDLVGHDAAGGRLVDCRACGHRWRRDLTPTCRLCGSTDLEAVPTATLEEAGRGEQRTPSGIRDVYRCFACGAKDATSSSPVPAEPGWKRDVVRPTRPRPVVDDLSRPARRVNCAFGTFEVGARIGGRWRLTSLRRWSSTASIWEAHDGSRTVVFRLVHPRIMPSRDRAALHARAARRVEEVGHPHVLRLLDVRMQHTDVLVVAEGAIGPTLAERVPLDAVALTEVGGGASDGLAALHADGVMHLDLRPDKLLLADDGRVRLIDFGSGRVRAADPDVPRSVDPLAWRAPEQIVGSEHTRAADVYSLAFSLWVAAGGPLDELGPTPSARAGRRVGGDLPRLDRGTTGLPTPVIDVIEAATRREPAQRPTAVELAAGLRAA
ncbi:MAG: protein kinase [Nitriliruptorales bacterium]|nr:protein kinase [Nitriliruptorales bacterium]